MNRKKKVQNMTRIHILSFLMTLASLSVNAQTDRQHIRTGNKAFRQENYAQAEVAYRKALEKNNVNPQALYNLGCALMWQQKDSAAVVQLENAGKVEKNPLRKAMVYHNIGIICQKKKMFAEAVEAYKESLRNNPSDNETRYNLELCKRQLKQQGGGGNNSKQQQQKKDSDKSKDKQNQQKEQQQKEQQNQQNRKQPQPKEQMSKDNVEQLLNAAVQQEKNTQDKLKKAMQQPQTRRLERNW